MITCTGPGCVICVEIDRMRTRTMEDARRHVARAASPEERWRRLFWRWWYHVGASFVGRVSRGRWKGIYQPVFPPVAPGPQRLRRLRRWVAEREPTMAPAVTRGNIEQWLRTGEWHDPLLTVGSLPVGGAERCARKQYPICQ